MPECRSKTVVPSEVAVEDREAAASRPVVRRLHTINQFCAENGISRVKAYQEISKGRLRAVKIDRATRIREEDAAAWRAGLPTFKAGA